MWFFHKLLGRVLLQMALLMVAFSLVQIARRQGVNRLYFTGVLFSGALALLTGFLAFVGAIGDGHVPGAIHVAYGIVSMFTLPLLHHFEQRSTDQRRAINIYLIAFIVLAICVWRGLETAS